ncbi:MAG: Ig-like domain-containing protein [Chloroflexota bacterium]|nr:MAG: Ig-like domain-containing protein [Chloroflexota bacterium]
MRKGIFIFLGLLLALSMFSFPADTLSAKTISTPQSPSSSPAALTADEKALIDDILRELDQARKLTNDRDIQDQIGVIKEWVKKVKTLADRGETEAALEIKYTIAKRLEWLINQLPTVTPGTTSAVAATATPNPLYDELVRIRAKIDKLIELEEREVPTITIRPYEPPEIQSPPEMEKLIVYSAKFLCGPALGGEGVQPGSYSTAINVHNPNNDTVYLFKKAVIAQREDEARGRISAFRRVMLNPDEAIEIDCIDIVRFFGAQQETGVTAPSQQTQTLLTTANVAPISSAVKFIKGFVVIYSTAPLDVVGVYTASTPVGFSLDIEHIPRSTMGTPVYVPEQPTCPQGCYCMTKDEALGKLGPNATMCQDQPCDKDASGVLRHCWKRGEEVQCPTGCVCMTEAAAKERGYTDRCQSEPCGRDQYQNLMYCFKMSTQQACPQGCVCLSKDDAYKRYGQNANMCQEQPCGYDAQQNPLYCWKPVEEAVCPQGCYCLTQNEAYSQLGNNATKCQDQPCGYATSATTGATTAAQIPKYCWKRAEQVQCPQGCYCLSQSDAKQRGYTDRCTDQSCGYDQSNNPMYCYKPPTQAQCPQGCVCVTPDEAKKYGYVYCLNQQMQCGTNRYCYQRAATTDVKPTPARILIDPTEARNPVGSQHTITVVVYDNNGKPMANVKVKISQTGANSSPPLELTTDGNGKCSYYYTGKNIGTDTIVATVDNLSAKATKTWYIVATPITRPLK